MDTRLLRAFSVLFEERNVTHAAQRLCVTQPTLSATLRQIEEALGTPLFTRLPRGLKPTDAAHRLYPEACRLLGELARMQTEFRAGQSCLELNLDIASDLGERFVASQLERLRPLAGELRIVLSEGRTGTLRFDCESGRGDGELFLPLCDDPFRLALPPDHPFTGRPALAAAEIVGANWILCPHDPSHLALLSTLGTHYPPCTDKAATLRLAALLVRAGHGMAWLPESLLDGLETARLINGDHLRRLGLCYAPDVLQQAASHRVVATLATEDAQR